MVSGENWTFWNYLSFRKTSLRKCLAMFYLVKKAILDDKNVGLLMVKKLKFSHGFCQKLKILKLFLFEHIRCRKVLMMYFIVNKPFWTRKMYVCKWSKNRSFPKGISHGFCEKLKILKLFLFEHIRCWKTV